MPQQGRQGSDAVLQNRNIIHLRNESKAVQCVEQEMGVDLVLQHFQLQFPLLPLILGILNVEFLDFSEHFVDRTGEESQLIVTGVSDPFIQICVRGNAAKAHHTVDRLHNAGVNHSRKQQTAPNEQHTDQQQGAVDAADLLGKVFRRNGNQQVAVQLRVIQGNHDFLRIRRERGHVVRRSLGIRTDAGKHLVIPIAETQQRAVLRGDDLPVGAEQHNIGAFPEGNLCQQHITDEVLVNIGENIPQGFIHVSKFVDFSAKHNFVIAAERPDVLQ